MKQRWRTITKAYKTAKQWLDEEKSVLSWLANLAIAFIIIKFLVYPGLGLLFGTGLPVVAVVSSSMDHGAIDNAICGNQVTDYKSNLNGYWATCGAWYEQHNITKEQFSTFHYTNGFNKGDIMVVFGRTTIRQGDVIVYEAGQNYPIIHRVTTVRNENNQTFYSTKGDHNPAPIQQFVLVQNGVAYACEFQGQPAPCFMGKVVTAVTPGAIAVLDETAVSKEKAIGEAVFRIPWLGYVKIWFTAAVQWIAGLF